MSGGHARAGLPPSGEEAEKVARAICQSVIRGRVLGPTHTVWTDWRPEALAAIGAMSEAWASAFVLFQGALADYRCKVEHPGDGGTCSRCRDWADGEVAEIIRRARSGNA